MKKLIVIEGVDASGKQTQSDLLYERLKKYDIKVKKISFPNYSSDSSAPVKMYLGGAFGNDADDVNPYVASTLFAADRVASVFGTWRKDIAEADVVIADRYVTSNMIHQASKIKSQIEKNAFLDWLYDFEYDKLDLPKPDLVLFLDMPVENAVQLMENRANKIDMSEVKDIHESDIAYLEASYDNAVFVAQKYSWQTVKCTKNGKIKSIEKISDEIYNAVLSLIL